MKISFLKAIIFFPLILFLFYFIIIIIIFLCLNILTKIHFSANFFSSVILIREVERIKGYQWKDQTIIYKVK